MKPSTKDQIAGAFHEMKGTVIEETGAVVANPDLTAEGQSEKIAGKVQQKIAQIERVVGS